MANTPAPSKTPEDEAEHRRQLTLEVIQGVNSEFLERLSDGARAGVTHFPFTEPLRSRLASLTEDERLKLAQLGVLLVDACFALPHRWRVAITEARAQNAEYLAAAHWLSRKDGLSLAYTTMHVAWSVLLWNSTDAGFLLGILPETAKLIGSLTVTDLVRVAEMKSHWLQPRWAEYPRVWVDLIDRTLANDPSVTLLALALSARLPSDHKEPTGEP